MISKTDKTIFYSMKYRYKPTKKSLRSPIHSSYLLDIYANKIIKMQEQLKEQNQLEDNPFEFPADEKRNPTIPAISHYFIYNEQIDHLRTLCYNNNYSVDEETLRIAIELGNVQILEILFCCDPLLDIDRALEDCVDFGTLEALDFFRKMKGKGWEKGLLNLAARSGRRKMFKWISENSQQKLRISALRALAFKGDTLLLDYCFEKDPGFVKSNASFIKAVACMAFKFNVLEWLGKIEQE